MRKIIYTLMLTLLLAACGSNSGGVPATPLDLEGIYGGYLNYQGMPFAAVAMDVTTTDGRVSGYAVGEDAYGYQVGFSVSGTTSTSDAIDLRLTDSVGDYIRLDGELAGVALVGQWTVNFSSESGSFRMVHEDDLGYLSTASIEAAQGVGSLRNLLR